MDFILELIDMGANTNLTDAENKTAFDIYMDQFQNFDMKKFSIKARVFNHMMKNFELKFSNRVYYLVNFKISKELI